MSTKVQNLDLFLQRDKRWQRRRFAEILLHTVFCIALGGGGRVGGSYNNKLMVCWGRGGRPSFFVPSQLSHFGRLLECRGLTEDLKHVLVISSVRRGREGYGGGSGQTADLQEEESGFSCFSSAWTWGCFQTCIFFSCFSSSCRVSSLESDPRCCRVQSKGLRLNIWASTWSPLSCFRLLLATTRQPGEKKTGKLWSLNLLWTFVCQPLPSNVGSAMFRRPRGEKLQQPSLSTSSSGQNLTHKNTDHDAGGHNIPASALIESNKHCGKLCQQLF